MKLDRSSTLYATLLLTGTGLFSQLLGFFYRIALSRLIGAEVMGLYQLIMPVYSVFMSIVAVGLTTAVSTLTAEYNALGRTAAIRQTLRRCLLIFFLLVLPLGAAVILCSDAISVYLLGDARTQLGLILLVPCILLTGVENLHKHSFYGAGNVRPPAFTELCEQIIRAAAVLGLLLVFLPQNPERTVGLIVTGMVICEVFSAVTLVILFRRQMGPRLKPDGPPVSWGRIASIAVPVGLTSLLGNLMGSANSVLIPQRLVVGGMEVSEAMSEFGVLCGMTVPLLNMPSALIGAMCLIMVPKLAESAALHDRRAIQRRLDRALLATSVLIMPATALLVVVGPTLGRLLFGDPRVGEHMLPLAVGVLLCCYQSVLSCALNGVGRQNAAARNSILCGAVQLLFTWFTVGIPGVGLKGYVAGFLVSSVLGLGLNLISTIRATGLRLRPFEWLVSPALASILMGLCVNLLFRWTGDQGASLPFSLVLCVVFGVVEYLAALQAQGVRLRELFRVGR
ncbi:MAG: polysaccharide biosynthesis C-terminal domain-containing protein [Oscillospiraceae bacterium]